MVPLNSLISQISLNIATEENLNNSCKKHTMTVYEKLAKHPDFKSTEKYIIYPYGHGSCYKSFIDPKHFMFAIVYYRLKEGDAISTSQQFYEYLKNIT